MTIAAASKVGAHVAGSQFANAPSGMGGDYNGEILLLLISTGGIIFIDHARQGQPQPGDQYAALGITGFILLFLGQFWPEVAFAFTLLILISVILNSPNGIPFMASGTPTGPTGQPLQPGQSGYGVVAPGHSVNSQGTAQ